jgi:hypothetical protein
MPLSVYILYLNPHILNKILIASGKKDGYSLFGFYPPGCEGDSESLN